MKLDIKRSNNFIGGRQGFAYICNSGDVKVIKIDLEAPQEYDDYRLYGKVKVAWKYGNKTLGEPCTLVHNSCEGQNSWELTSGGTCLSGSFTYQDAINSIEESQLPLLHPDEIVALAFVTSNSVTLGMYQVSEKIDIHCTTVATLKELSDIQMDQLVGDAESWCK